MYRALALCLPPDTKVSLFIHMLYNCAPYLTQKNTLTYRAAVHPHTHYLTLDPLDLHEQTTQFTTFQPLRVVGKQPCFE